MIEIRRAFLRDLGLGAAGASLLAVPGQALAFGRKRRATVVESCPIQSFPVEQGPIKRPELLRGTDIQMSFPLDGSPASDPYVIYGGGTFFTWGKWASDVIAIVSVTVVDVGNTAITGVTATPITPPLPCKWAYSIRGVPTDTTVLPAFRLKVVYGKLVGGVPVQQAPLYFSYFRCDSAFES